MLGEYGSWSRIEERISRVLFFPVLFFIFADLHYHGGEQHFPDDGHMTIFE